MPTKANTTEKSTAKNGPVKPKAPAAPKTPTVKTPAAKADKSEKTPAPAAPKAPADKAEKTAKAPAPSKPKAPAAKAQAKPKASAGVVFRVDRDSFAGTVAWVARHVPARPPVPVMAGIRLDLEAGRLTMSAYDYEVSAEETITVDGIGKMSVLVPGRLLASIAAALPDQEVEITTSGAKVAVTCGTARYSLLTMPVEDYPALPELPPLVGTFNGKDLAAAVKRAVVAAGRDDTVPMLTGVQMKTKGTEVTFAATDRYRLSVATCTWRPAAPDTSREAVLPWRTLHDAAKMFASADDVNVHIGEGENAMLGLSGGNRRITTRLRSSSFPDCQKLIPTEFGSHADLPTSAFTDAVKRVVLIAERDTPARFAFTRGQVVIEAGDGDDAHAVETLPVEWTGPDMTIMFNSTYLLDGVTAVGAGTVRLKANAANQPALLSGVTDGGDDAPGSAYLIMPVHLQS